MKKIKRVALAKLVHMGGTEYGACLTYEEMEMVISSGYVLKDNCKDIAIRMEERAKKGITGPIWVYFNRRQK